MRTPLKAYVGSSNLIKSAHLPWWGLTRKERRKVLAFLFKQAGKKLSKKKLFRLAVSDDLCGAKLKGLTLQIARLYCKPQGKFLLKDPAAATTCYS